MGLTRPRAAQIYNIDYKQAVRVVTISNITLSGGAPNAVDGVNLSTNDRVLVTGQTTGSQNGLYYVTTVGAGNTGTWARTTDSNETGEVDAGMVVMVTEGTTYADTQWQLTTDNPIVIGTTSLAFSRTTSSSTGSSITNGTSNVVIASSGNVSVGVAGTSNIAVFSSTGVYATGVVSASGNITGNYILGNGSQLTGISGGSATLSGNLAGNLTGNSYGADAFSFVSATGNITGGNLIQGATRVYKWTTATSAPANPVAGDEWYNSSTDVLYKYINDSVGSQWVDQSFPTSFGNITIAGNANVTGTIAGSGNLSVTGNISGGYILGSGNISLAGNVTGNYILGNGSQLTGIASGTASNIESGTSNVKIVSSGGNVSVGVGGIANLAVFDTAGNTTITGNLLMTGNVIPTANNVYALGAPTMTWKEVYIGPGSLYINGQQVLSSSADTIVVSANANQNLALQTSGSGGIRLDPTGDGIIQVQGPLQIAAGNNITSSDGNAIQFASSIGVDNITSRTANNNLTLTANGTGTVAVTSPFSASGNILSAGLVSVAGNVTGGNINTAGLVSVAGNVTGGNLNTAGLLSVTGTATIGGNVNLSGSIIPSANITYDLGSPTNRFRTLYISGNTIDMGGAKITTDATSGGFALVPPPTTDNPNPVGTVFSPTGAISTINTTAGIIAAGAINTSINNNQGTANFGNIVVRSGLPSIGSNVGALKVIGGTGISGNLNVGELISATGNIIGGNVLTGGLISATGNVIGGNLSGTSIAGTLTTAAQTNITSVGTLGSVTVTANITSGNASLGNLATANFFTGNGSQLSALTFGNISTFNTAGLTTDELYLQSTTRLNVTASGSSGYIFDQYAPQSILQYMLSVVKHWHLI